MKISTQATGLCRISGSFKRLTKACFKEGNVDFIAIFIINMKGIPHIVESETTQFYTVQKAEASNLHS